MSANDTEQLAPAGVAQFTLNLNLESLSGQFFVRLQHLLDAIQLLEIGARKVGDEDLRDQKGFGTLSPASNHKLGLEAAREFAADWLLKCFLRDAIEYAALFLEECLLTCALVSFAAQQKSTLVALEKTLGVSEKNNKLPFPEKIKKLEDDYSVTAPKSIYLLSLNNARNCLAHRNGIVAKKDAGSADKMTIKWFAMDVVSTGVVSGREAVITEPFVTTEETAVSLRFKEHERSYSIGEVVKLTHYELYSTIITSWQWGIEVTRSIQQFCEKLGVTFSGAAKNAARNTQP